VHGQARHALEEELRGEVARVRDELREERKRFAEKVV